MRSIRPVAEWPSYCRYTDCVITRQPAHYTVQFTRPYHNRTAVRRPSLSPRVHLARLPKGIRLKQKLIANIFLLTFPFHKMFTCALTGNHFFAVYHALMFPTKVSVRLRHRAGKAVFQRKSSSQSSFRTSSLLKILPYTKPKRPVSGKVCKSLFVLAI